MKKTIDYILNFKHKKISDYILTIILLISTYVFINCILNNIGSSEIYTYKESIIFYLIFTIRIVSYFFIKDEKDYKISIETILLINIFLLAISIQLISYYSSFSFIGFAYYISTFLILLKSFQILLLYFKRKLLLKRIILLNIWNNFSRVYKLLIAGIIIVILNQHFVVNYLRDQLYINMNYIEIIPNIIILIYIISIVIDYYHMCNSAEKISKGNFNKKIKTNYKIFKPLTETINHINDGMQIALEEKVKSERLKTDLITNVSHDLKTPLTSIINYVKLLKKEEIDNKKINNYIDVIDKKADHLKSLTDDLIEASKISSGYEKPNFEKLDITELVKQANGEFLEKFNEKKLEIVDNIPSEEIILLLDSKKTWRVFDNIYSNVFKYALKNTRVYVDIKNTEEKVIFSIKNISKDKLNILPDELMERFVRGDSSRNTSGHGLGLSIAKNLIEMQNGTFHIYIEGDLFKIEIEFFKN